MSSEEILRKMGFAWRSVTQTRGECKGFSFKPKPPCFVYSCGKCPYFHYPFCFYEEEGVANDK